MKNAVKIAIIGCGTAGLAAASFLQRSGHHIELFEKFDTPKPVGAGLLLQPTGLACLAALGLDQAAIQAGSIINSLYGQTTTDRIIFDINYRDLNPGYFGVGISRSALFDLLFGAVKTANIPVRTSAEITDAPLINDKRTIVTKDRQEFGPFDLVIEATGRNSRLRPKHLVKFHRPYPYGAIWGLLQDPEQAFGSDRLQQRYRGANVMMGMLAIGKGLTDEVEKCTFFWSLPPGGYDIWLKAGMDKWKRDVSQIWPDLEPFLSQFQRSDALMFAQYSDIIMKQWHDERIAFIGDAGHNSSPQLGQGANLALADAFVLNRCLEDYSELQQALAAYSKARKSHIHFYQFASRALTPFFQSDSKVCAWLRDMTFPLLPHIPLVKKEMLKTLTGIKTGAFSHLDPKQWDSKYGL